MDKQNDTDKALEQLLLTDEEAATLRNVFRRSHHSVPDVEEQWNKIASEINDQSQPRCEESETRSASIYNVRARTYYILGGLIAVAACLFCLFILHKPEPLALPDNIAMQAIDEQTHAVVLSGEKGAPVNVGEQELSFAQPRQAASASSHAGQQMTITTPRGKDCHLVLPDGTKVWLNDESKLEFPSQFDGGKRVVRLKGEAFFEVAKDKQHPFVVENEYFTTTVLGTVFNVRAYGAQDASIILVSGRVALTTGFLSETKYIAPGEKAVCGGRNEWTVHVEDTYPYLQRKDGYFYFDHLTLHQIMAEIGRWYNKTVVFENTDLMSLRLHFVAERKQSLESVIEALNQMDGVSVELGKDEIVVR